MKVRSIAYSVVLTLILGYSASPALYANIAELKKYKEAFPGETVKCIGCHTAAMPKKDGDHSMNAYGQKVMEQGTPTTVENYKTAGKA